MLKRLIRTLVPESLINRYHYSLARAAAVLYRHPSNELVVIGVTGTNGKSSTTEFIGRMLEHAGARVGWTGTASFKIAEQEWVNDQKMTMLGRFATQKMLRQMVDAGCTYAIVETSSQGISQSRHVGINYDVVVFTNLTPEHIEAHGGFENYKHAKKQLFVHTKHSRRKKIQGQVFEKTAVVNLMSPYATEFLSVGLDRSFGFGIDTMTPPPARGEVGRGAVLEDRPLSIVPIIAEDVVYAPNSTGFLLNGLHFHVPLVGRFYLENALAAISVCRALGLDFEALRDAVSHLETIPGRFERIEEGQSFSVVVDYAYEPAALNAIYDTIKLFAHKKIIHVVGSAGGGRDVARRPILGRMCADMDSIVIVTNEDPYDDDPQEIIDQVADAAIEAGKKEGIDLFRVLDRGESIEKAILLAQPGDLVLITGKGCEPVMAVANGKKIPWDDRSAARAALHKRLQTV
ncbi:MAG: UDP-N-acetylmuramyl-tripeptide synthetase [Candidatus Uhrbacteria bacterium]|nr:UDP-N-acetylmuramyl-tripeptide synthetase [Candidatus Uhrbacteria bacterium]